MIKLILIFGIFYILRRIYLKLSQPASHTVHFKKEEESDSLKSKGAVDAEFTEVKPD